MNTDLVESLVTVMQEQIISDSNTTNPALTSNKKKIDITETLQYNSQPTKNSLSTDIYIEASELTPAEQLAQEVTYTRKWQQIFVFFRRHLISQNKFITLYLSNIYFYPRLSL